jgi:hypothetical protein
MRRKTLLIGLTASAIVAATLVRGEPRIAQASVAPAPIDSIASPTAAGAAEPNLSVARDGRVYMSWLEPVAAGGHALRFAVLTGTRWSAPQTIRSGSDFFVNWADFPSIQVLDGGRLVAHWLQRTGTGTYAYGVRISQSADGGKTWSAPITPHRDSADVEHGFVAMWREGGKVGAVWLDGRKSGAGGHDAHAASSEMMLMSTMLDGQGRLDAEIQLDGRTCDCCQNSAAMTASGPVVVYRDRSPDEIRDIYVTRRVAGQWTPGVAVHADRWKVDFCPVNGPAVAASGRRIAVGWFTAANDSPQVKVAFSNDAGATFAAPIRIDGGTPTGRVDVAMLSDGGALVTWIERGGGDTAAVKVRRVGRDGRAGAPMTVAQSSAARASGFPRMAVTGTDVVFAWTVPGRPSRIRVARGTAAAIR